MRRNIAVDKADVLQVCFTNPTWELFAFPFFDFSLDVLHVKIHS